MAYLSMKYNIRRCSSLASYCGTRDIGLHPILQSTRPAVNTYTYNTKLDTTIFTHLCLYFVFYTHCSLVCLLHYVCDFMYICILSPVLLVLALSRS